MANKEMKTLTMGGNTYEIVDKATRDRVDILEDNQLVMTDNGNGEVNLTTTNISMIDGSLSESSTNAIQNRAVTAAINEVNKSISQNKTQINELKNSTRIKLDTIWENASPTSNFANQSISLDLNQYKYIYIQTRGYCKSSEDLLNGAPVMHFCLVGEYAMLIHPINTNICRRLTHVTTNSISFAEGYSDTTVANDCVIPLKIYGVK